MLSVRSRITIVRPTSELLVLKTSPWRRILFAIIAVVLLVGLIAGATAADFAPPRLGGTIFYFCLLAICLTVAGWDRRIWFDRGDAGIPRSSVRLFFIPAGGRALSTARPECVVVQHLKLIRSEELGHGNPVSRRVSSYILRRSSMFKLMLETEERSITLEDSSDRTEMERAGEAIADFLSVPYRFEEG